MKATLRFDLDDIDDRMAHFRCTKALDMALCLYALKEVLFRDDIPAECRQAIYNAFDEYDIDLNQLIR